MGDDAVIAMTARLDALERAVEAMPLDRISVRDHVREVEIGAFTSEKGVTQKIRFNVVLEVSRHAASVYDDVDQVVSYDDIVDAIDRVLAAERLNLLETCAERVAEQCLKDPRAGCVIVRVEKLDRIPGALGVEIVRRRVPADVPKMTPSQAGAAPAPAQRPVIAVMAADAILPGVRGAWRDALRALTAPVAIVIAPGVMTRAAEAEGAALDLPAAARRRVAALALDQAAWSFAADDPGFSPVDSRTELLHALKTEGVAVWAPSRLIEAAPESPENTSGLIMTLVETLDAQHVLMCGDFADQDDVEEYTNGVKLTRHIRSPSAPATN